MKREGGVACHCKSGFRAIGDSCIRLCDAETRHCHPLAYCIIDPEVCTFLCKSNIILVIYI